MVENFPPVPGKEGGVRERSVWGPPGFGRENIPSLSQGEGGGAASSRVGLEMGGWFRPLPGGTPQARVRGGGGGLGVCIVAGWGVFVKKKNTPKCIKERKGK